MKDALLAQMELKEFEVLRLLRDLTDPDNVPPTQQLQDKIQRLLELAGYRQFTGQPGHRGRRRVPE